MSGRSRRRWPWRASLAVAALLAGCSTTPTAPPAGGETVESVVERMYEMHVEYQFVAGGHRYTSARAAAPSGEYYHLVFIDGALGCQEMPGYYGSMEEFRTDDYRDLRDYSQWEWVAEPDGLDYLASRLREHCGMEPKTPARPLPDDRIATVAEVTIREEPSTAEQVGGMLLGSVLMSVWLVYGPLFAVADGAWEAAVHSAAQSASQRVLTGLPQPEHVVTKLLGAPDVQFDLPESSTVVLAYDPESGRSLYVGIRDGQAVWVHGEHPWLDELAEQALAGTQGKSDR